MKTRNVILAVLLVFIFSVAARAQSTTTTNCDSIGDTHVTCTSTTDRPYTPPPSPIEQLNKELDAAKARRQAAQAAQQQAEASCVGGGGTFYEGHCLTQQQYDENRKQETDWVAQQQTIREQVRVAKFAAQDAKDAKKDAEREAKAAKKQAEKDAKAAKKSQQVAGIQ
jgi:type IV secretory pathway VirB10-like protein